MLIPELIRRGALYHRDRTALLFGERSMSFAEVDSLSCRIAQVLGGAVGLGKIFSRASARLNQPARSISGKLWKRPLCGGHSSVK